MTDCKSCENKKWKDMYITSQQRFDRVVVRLTVGSIIAFTIAILCLIATICTIIRVHKFINEFEYVEETEIQIEQDKQGSNTVVLQNGDEVVLNGTDLHREEEEILAKESKVNSINVYR